LGRHFGEIAGHDDDRQIGRPDLQRGCEFGALQSRHRLVGEQQVTWGAGVFQIFDTSFGGSVGADVVTDAFEGNLDKAAHQLFVVDHADVLTATGWGGDLIAHAGQRRLLGDGQENVECRADAERALDVDGAAVGAHDPVHNREA